MTIHIINGIKVSTHQEYVGWSAVDDNTYDCDCDQDGFFSLSPVGHGDTEQSAIAALLERLEEREA